jgi:hypothetical protein
MKPIVLGDDIDELEVAGRRHRVLVVEEDFHRFFELVEVFLGDCVEVKRTRAHQDEDLCRVHLH